MGILVLTLLTWIQCYAGHADLNHAEADRLYRVLQIKENGAVAANAIISEFVAQRAVTRAQAIQISQFMEGFFKSEKFKSEIVKLYARHFSKQEIADLCDFYQSPAGAKVLRISPQLGSEMTKIVINEINARTRNRSIAGKSQNGLK